MYSEELKKMKKNINYLQKYTGKINKELLIDFCDKDAIINNTIQNIYNCWLKYCKLKNIEPCSPNVLGNAIKKTYNLKSKKIRLTKDKTTMYYYE